MTAKETTHTYYTFYNSLILLRSLVVNFLTEYCLHNFTSIKSKQEVPQP